MFVILLKVLNWQFKIVLFNYFLYSVIIFILLLNLYYLFYHAFLRPINASYQRHHPITQIAGKIMPQLHASLMTYVKPNRFPIFSRIDASFRSSFLGINCGVHAKSFF